MGLVQATAEVEVPQVEASFVFKNDILIVSTGTAWCSNLIHLAETVDKWEQGTLVSARTPAYQHSDRNNDVVMIDGINHPDFAPIKERLDRLIGQCAGLYRVLNKHIGITQVTGLQLLRYKQGQHFHEHVDNIAGHPTWGQRQLSVVFYLNDDYEGGEISFQRQAQVIKPKAGDVLLFPSHFTHPHASLDVRSGVKYAVVTWFV